jgi:AcrR family transcriptional regulator
VDRAATGGREAGHEPFTRAGNGAETEAGEIRTIIDATYRVIARTSSLDPSMRDILREAGLSTPAFYRHFKGKDELLLVLLDDGRRHLASYLAHRMAKHRSPRAKVEAWIRGVIAQAADPTAADRTRPFIAHLPRLADRYPGAHSTSLQVLVDPLITPIATITGRPRTAAADANLVALVALGTMEAHLRERTYPTAKDADHVVRFSLRALEPQAPRRGRSTGAHVT